MIKPPAERCVLARQSCGVQGRWGGRVKGTSQELGCSQHKEGMTGLVTWGRFPISVDLETRRGKETFGQEPGGFSEVGGPVGEPVMGAHTRTSGQTLPQCLSAFILRGTLMKWGWGGVAWVAGSCVLWEQFQELEVFPLEKERLWGP